jgi:hypothetical protein
MVEMGETNGHGESRLDRIEALLDRHSNMFVVSDAAMERHSAMIASTDAAMERHSTMIVSIEAAMERIDASIDRQILANEAAHERFAAEDKRLLTAQILMNSAMQKMADGMISLEVKMEETTGKLNALIATVDGLIGKRLQ